MFHKFSKKCKLRVVALLYTTFLSTQHSIFDLKRPVELCTHSQTKLNELHYFFKSLTYYGFKSITLLRNVLLSFVGFTYVHSTQYCFNYILLVFYETDENENTICKKYNYILTFCFFLLALSNCGVLILVAGCLHHNTMLI